MSNDDIFVSHKSLCVTFNIVLLVFYFPSALLLLHYGQIFRILLKIFVEDNNWMSLQRSIKGPTSKKIKPRFHHYSLLFITTARQMIIQGYDEWQKWNMFRLTKQTLCECITLFCIHISIFTVVVLLRRAKFLISFCEGLEHKTIILFSFLWTWNSFWNSSKVCTIWSR